MIQNFTLQVLKYRKYYTYSWSNPFRHFQYIVERERLREITPKARQSLLHPPLARRLSEATLDTKPFTLRWNSAQITSHSCFQLAAFCSFNRSNIHFDNSNKAEVAVVTNRTDSRNLATSRKNQPLSAKLASKF